MFGLTDTANLSNKINSIQIYDIYFFSFLQRVYLEARNTFSKRAGGLALVS